MGALVGTINAGTLDLVAAMSATLCHRGSFAGSPKQVGSAILACMCDSAGSQPAHRQHLTIAGDIDLYNQAQLVVELEKANIRLVNDSAEQIMLAAWDHWGTASLTKFNGDFAIAVHDDRDGSVTLARDLAGARPLYYAKWAGGLAFASEYKALLVLPDFKRRVDLDALQYLQSRKLLPADRSLLSGVFQLPAGCWWRLGTKGADAHPVRYFEAKLHITKRSVSNHAQTVRQAFMDAVQRRIQPTGTIGIALSGGIDSIAIVAAARKLCPDREILTFSAGDRKNDPELEWAARVAQTYNTAHTALVVGAESMMEDLPNVVWHLEDPIARSETLLTYKLAQAAHGKTSFMLGGYAADGLFAGMPRHRILALAQKMPLGRTALGDIYSYTQTGVKPSSLIGSVLAKLYFGDRIPRVPQVHGAEPPLPVAPLPMVRKELVNQVLAAGTTLGLSPWVQKVERTLASTAVRFASPFFDPHLIDIAFSIPSRYKHTIRCDKYIWRRAAQSIVPEEFAQRPKYPQRMQESLAFCDALAALAKQQLTDGPWVDRGWFDMQEIDKLLNRPKGGVWPPEHAMRIWTLVLTELWAKLFLDQPGTPPKSHRTLPTSCGINTVSNVSPG